MNILLRVLRYFLYVILAGIVLAVLVFALLQSKWAKTKLQEGITSSLQQAGVEASFSIIEGQLPFSWKIEKMALHFSNGQTLSLEDISIRLALTPLLQGRFVIDSIHAQKGSYTLPLTNTPFIWEQARPQINALVHSLSFPIHLNHIGIDLLTIHKGDSLLSFGMTGKWMRDQEAFSMHCHLFSPDGKLSYLDTSLQASKQMNKVDISSTVHLPNTPLQTLFTSDLHGSVHIKGSFDHFCSLLEGNTIPKGEITGTMQAFLPNVQTATAPLVDGNWSFKSAFSIASFDALHLHKGILKKEGVLLKASGILSFPFQQSSCALALSLTLPHILHANQVHAKGNYKAGLFHLNTTLQGIQWGSFQAQEATFLLQGKVEKEAITADLDLYSQDLFLKSHIAYTKEQITLSDLIASSLQDQLTASMSYSLPSSLFEGSVHIEVEDINRFEPFLNENHLHGKVALDLNLAIENEKQKGLLSLSGAYLRFDDFLVDDLFLKAHIHDPFGSIEGGLYCLAENVFTPRFYLNRCLLEAESLPDLSFLFSLDLTGRTDLPFYLTATGTGKKEQEDLTLCLLSANGVFADIPFLLDHTATLTLTPSLSTLSPFEMTLGEGHLALQWTKTPLLLDASLNASHFPLVFLRPLYPHIALAGFASSAGFVKADNKNLQGSLNIALEEAALTAPNASDSLHSKGSLQVHVDQNRLQAFVDLKAEGQQFVELTSSLPTQYTLYPFAFGVDPRKPSSSELTLEGKLEDLFDFINLGTNHFSGWLSSRLFLSQTLQAPSLVGSIEWKQGGYENDFTGIRLNNIDAQMEAKNDSIELVRLTGQDGKDGSVFATGLMELKPKAAFPFHITADMKALHAVEFDMIDSTLSGPLYLFGNLHEMTAQGNLIIDKALVRIGERLPYDIPYLPFTYIHKPSSLDSSTLKRKGIPFTFHMDLDITAEQTVQAEGKGIQAELDGHLHLKGTNANVTASGSLDLVKGEYSFAGKVFKLTEGNLLFNDKSSPFAYLNVSGILNLADTTITVTLRGPITSPQLFFHSNPQKPTSSILALILFDKEISEINQMEALQLAATLISLSGGAGPDLLESIRKTIGVDRLNISSVSGGDDLAVQVQIGKYLVKGVMITLAQSATSSRIIVEVELPKGFVFQAETQEEEEGKFSLKWRKNY